MTSSIAFCELRKSFARSGHKFEINQRRTHFYTRGPAERNFQIDLSASKR